MDIFMDAAGRRYVADIALNVSDCKLPICTKELFDVLTAAGKPLLPEEIAAAFLAKETAIPQTQGDVDEADVPA